MISVVTVWTIRIEDEVSAIDRHWRVLDQAERTRAGRYRREADRQRFVLARGTLRHLLSNALGMKPEAIVLSSNSYGRLEVRCQPMLSFNTSHAGDWVLHAFSTVGRVGIDVEQLVENWAEYHATATVLAPAEGEWLMSLPESERCAAFTTLWVRKEAYVKALGVGLNRPPHEVCVWPFAPAGLAELASEGAFGPRQEQVSFCPIELGEGYAACVAFLGPAPKVHIRKYGVADTATTADSGEACLTPPPGG